MSDTTSYSVVIPAYNARPTLAETLQSVARQTRAPEAIIVVDDGSTDDTADIAERFAGPVRVIRQTNAGVGSATTAGIAAVSTPLVAMLDSDDLWLPHKMERQLARLLARPDLGGIFAHLRTFRDASDIDGAEESPGWSRTTLAMRTEDALRVGPIIDPEGGRGDMIDWIARAREIGVKLEMLPEVLALRRVRPGSLSYGRDANRDRGYAQVAWLALQRRKKLEKDA